MNKYIESLKERIIAWVDDLENAIHEQSFDIVYETWYDIGFNDGYSKRNKEKYTPKKYKKD